MAIIKNVVMRGASQKLGGVVFYTRKGETVARELAPSVSNPRTYEQMKQRVRLSNVVNAYKANKSWIDGAFEDKAEKETDYNAFVRFNLTDSKVALSKGAAAAGSAVVSPYKISSGSIQEITCTGQTTGVLTDIFTGDLIITNATTVGQLSAAILTNNNGVSRGMQLSLIVNIQRMNETTNRPFIVTRAYEIIINETNTDLLSNYFPEGILQTLDSEGRPLFYNGTILGDGAAAFILSETVGGRTRVSTQTLVQYGNRAIYTIYTSPLAVADAIASYGENADRFLDASKADEYNNVVLHNYIQGVGFNDHIYTNGEEIPTSLTTGDVFEVYFGQPVPSGTEFTFNADGTAVASSKYSINFNAARNKMEVRMTQTVGVSEPTACDFTVEYGEDVLLFEFFATPQ